MIYNEKWLRGVVRQVQKTKITDSVCDSILDLRLVLEKFLELEIILSLFTLLVKCGGVDSANRGQETYGGGSLRVSVLCILHLSNKNYTKEKKY